MQGLNVIKEDTSLNIDDKFAIEESNDLISRFKRNRREENSIHWCFIVILWIIVVGFGFAILAKFVQMVLPVKLCWLNDTQVKNLNEFITTGGIGGIGTALFKSKFNRGNK